MWVLYGMKTLAFISTILFSFNCFSEQYRCTEHSGWPNERSFTATIEVAKESVTVSNLQLSELWPLPEHCDAPLIGGTTKYKRNMHIKEVSFGPYSDNECGYVYSLNFDEKDFALLHVVRSVKVWGRNLI